MKAQQQPRTPTKVLAKQIPTTSKVVGRIKEGEKLCIEVFDVVSTMWGFLLEDETTAKFADEACQAELKIAMVKGDMKKLPLKYKVSKVADMKHLQ